MKKSKKKKIKAEDWEDDDLWRQNGHYMITVNYGVEKLGRFIVKAGSYGKAIQKIVNDALKEYPESFEYDSVITFTRETFEELI